MERITGSSVTVKATFYKLALDQGVFAPLFQFPVLTYIGFLQGQNLADIKTKIRSQWWDIVTTGWKVRFLIFLKCFEENSWNRQPAHSARPENCQYARVFLQGQNFADIKKKIRSQWWDIVTTGWKGSTRQLCPCLHTPIKRYITKWL